MTDEYLTLDEAARRSGLHSNTLMRLVRRGILHGYKGQIDGRRRWLISAASLRRYTDPINGFLLDLPGPKLYLTKGDEEE